LEHLLFYGANPSSQNASGNTALHISALYNKASSETDSLYETVVARVPAAVLPEGVTHIALPL